MPKIPRLTSKNLIKLVEQAGFVLDHCSGSHYIYFHEHSSKRVVVPYHTKTLPIGTIKSILRSADIDY